MNRMRKTTIAVATLGVAAFGLSNAASAQNAFVGGLAGGFLGSVVGTAIVAGSQPHPAYGYQPNGYYAQPMYQPVHCWWQVQTSYGPFGPYQHNVKVCG